MKLRMIMKEACKLAGIIFVAFFMILGCYAFVSLETTDSLLRSYTLGEIQASLQANDFMNDLLLVSVICVIGGYVVFLFLKKVMKQQWKIWKLNDKKKANEVSEHAV